MPLFALEEIINNIFEAIKFTSWNCHNSAFNRTQQYQKTPPIIMILTTHPLALPLLLFAAASNFNLASAGKAFTSRSELEGAVNAYCFNDQVDFPEYG